MTKKTYKVRIWYFSRGNVIPICKTDFKTVNEKDFLSYFNDDLISVEACCGYYSIKKYAHYNLD